ncbi:MAG: butyrate kinase [Bacteroidota bacterium]
MMELTRRVLVVNPGSTSTKAGLYGEAGDADAAVFRHEGAELSSCRTIWDQLNFRLEQVRAWLQGRSACAPVAVVSLGGLLRPLSGGVYRVTGRMLEDAREGKRGHHASNLGCAMAHDLAAGCGCPAYVADPVSVDEMEPLARYSGHPLIERSSLSHALNIHATARKGAAATGKRLEASRFVVAHLGGGISVAPVRGGRIVDVNDASSGGPFSPERTGGLPAQGLIGLCFSGRYSEEEMRRLVMGQGGLRAYLGTASAAEVEARIRAGDETAREVYEAMAYQIAKEIGAMSTVLAGGVDAVLLTGGLAASEMLTRWIRERVGFLGPVLVFPGEGEMEALAEAAWRILRGEETALEY